MLASRCALIAALLIFALQPSSANETNSMQQPPFVQGAPRSERRWMGSFAFAGIPQLKHRARHRGIYGTQFNTKP
uniref:Secreted protein n=1 Tax=Ascaris lumbricoides TaxID=6252 RepID=A0A0M3HYP3_ASCLU